MPVYTTLFIGHVNFDSADHLRQQMAGNMQGHNSLSLVLILDALVAAETDGGIIDPLAYHDLIVNDDIPSQRGDLALT